MSSRGEDDNKSRVVELILPLDIFRSMEQLVQRSHSLITAGSSSFDILEVELRIYKLALINLVREDDREFIQKKIDNIEVEIEKS